MLQASFNQKIHHLFFVALQNILAMTLNMP